MAHKTKAQIDALSPLAFKAWLDERLADFNGMLDEQAYNAIQRRLGIKDDDGDVRSGL